jgi:hemoglobin/transferrin/lactoferrin receptor protein
MKKKPFTFSRNQLAAGIAAALCFPALAIADSETTEQTPEEVVVWGTEVSSSSVKLDSDIMAIKQADHISDLLRPVPGVDVGGAHSLNQRITIRSMDDKDLKITIDGANQNTYMYHHMGNLQIHADILKSADIDVGNNSVVNGGLGGAVRFETKEAKELLKPGSQFGGRVQATVSDNASDSVAVTGYGQLNDSFDFLAYYNVVSRDNYEVGDGEIVDQNGDEIAGTNGEVRGLEGDLDDFLVKFGWDISPSHRLSFGYEFYKDEGDYSYRPDMGLATDIVIAETLEIPLTFPTEFTRDTLTLKYAGQVGATDISASLFKNISELNRDESGLASWRPPAAGDVTGEATNTGLNLMAVTDITALGEHSFTYGFDIIKYDTDYQFKGEQPESESEKAKSSAIFVEDRWLVGGGFSVIPGVRYEDYDIDSAVVDDSFSDTTLGLGLEYDVNSDLLLHASATQLFKGPEIGETFSGAGLYDVPNEDIDAESGLNTEIGFAYEAPILGAERFSVGVTLFETEINDYIYDYASHPSEEIRAWKDNVGDLTIEGYEFYAGYDIGGLAALVTYSSAETELDAFGQYTFLEEENARLNLDGARLSREQGDTLTLSLDYTFAAIDTTLHWDFMDVDDLDAGLVLDSTVSDSAKEGYKVHNISARWQPEGSLDGLAVTLGVDNLFDEFYVSQSSRTGTSNHPLFGTLYLADFEPGRNIKMTVSYDF